MSKGAFAAAGSLFLMALAGFGADRLERPLRAERGHNELANAESSAAVTVLGQFRTTISSWLWLRTDLYLHNGVEMRTLTDEEMASGRTGVGGDEHGPGAVHDDFRIVTVVPEASRDFRGLIGDLERATSAYRPMGHHSHNDPAAALPLFRLMTWLDPSFIPGWVVGASVISRQRDSGADEKALAFLGEGIRENPGSVAIQAERARITLFRSKDATRAISQIEEILRRDGLDPKQMSEMDAEALQNCFRWLALCYRDAGRTSDMREAAQKGLRLFPGDPVLERALNTRTPQQK